MSVQKIITNFSMEVQKILGNSLSKIILYGSYARGDTHDTSDIDIMILTTLTDSEIKKIENDIYDYAFELELEYGVDISPIIINNDQFEYWVDTLPFYRNVEEEGIIVA